MKSLLRISIIIICCLSATYAKSQVNCNEVFDFSITYPETLCEGSTGSAQVNIIMGGGATYWYEWSTGAISAGIEITNPGTFAVTVTDTYYNCSETKTFSIGQSPALTVAIDKTDISCYGENDGVAIANVNGGTEPYSYQWTTTLHSDTISNLVAGTYGVTATDVNGCSGFASASITEPSRFVYTITPNQGICRGEQVTVSTNATGGRAPYSYQWGDADVNVPSRILSPEETTQYSVTVIDASGCTFAPQTTRVIVSQPISISVETENVSCHSVCDGSAVLTIEGGIPPFVYSWNSSTDHIENLCDGIYTLSMTDIYECSGSASFTISEPDTIYLSTISGPATCFGYADGFVQVSASGGTHFETGNSYHYIWDGGQTTANTAIGAGMHTVTVTDANGCMTTAQAFVDQPEAVYVTEPNPNGGTICIGESFSSVVNATGGEGPYEFVWTSGPLTWYGNHFTARPTETITYTLRVTDINGCTAPSKQMTINVNPQIEISSVTQDVDEICLGDKVELGMEITGGDGGPYRITIDNYGIINTPYNIYPTKTGFYPFTASDICGSPTDRDSIFVIVHELPTIGFYSDKAASCPPGIFQFHETSTDSARTYYWDFGNEVYSTLKDPIQTYDETGVYNVSLTVTSSFGCQNTKTKNNMIIIYEEPRAEFVVDPDVTSILTTEIKFINYSEGGVTYLWNFGDGNTSIWSNDVQIHSYNKAGNYKAMLVAKNEHECVDTAYKNLTINDVYTFYAPSAFSPNGDGINDYFYVSGNGIDYENFKLIIYNRFGEKMFNATIFDMEEPNRMAWDGTNDGNILNGDPVVTTGAYNWVCSFYDFTGKPHEKKGTVFLVK